MGGSIVEVAQVKVRDTTAQEVTFVKREFRENFGTTMRRMLLACAY